MKEEMGTRGAPGTWRLDIHTEHPPCSHSLISAFLWVLALQALLGASVSQPLLDNSCRWSLSGWFELHGHPLDQSLVAEILAQLGHGPPV